MFEFEHIIRLNLVDLDREKLWGELVAFSRSPEDYIEEITRSESSDVEKSSGEFCEFERTTWFGKHEIKERVVLSDEDYVLFSLVAVNGIPTKSSFKIKIEEPEDGVFFLRFSYNAPMTQEEKQYPQIDSLKKQAYQQKDFSLVQKLQEKLMHS